MEHHSKRFRIVDAETETSIVIVEAENAKQAIERFSIVQSVISLQKRPGKLWQCIEFRPDEPPDVPPLPVFIEGFFQVLDSLGSVKH